MIGLYSEEGLIHTRKRGVPVPLFLYEYIHTFVQNKQMINEKIIVKCITFTYWFGNAC